MQMRLAIEGCVPLGQPFSGRVTAGEAGKILDWPEKTATTVPNNWLRGWTATLVRVVAGAAAGFLLVVVP